MFWGFFQFYLFMEYVVNIQHMYYRILFAHWSFNSQYSSKTLKTLYNTFIIHYNYLLCSFKTPK